MDTAAEAVVGLARGRDREARRLLAMKRAEAFPRRYRHVSARPNGRRPRRCRRASTGRGRRKRVSPRQSTAHCERPVGAADTEPERKLDREVGELATAGERRLSQRGCSPRPLQDSPVEVLRYLAATLVPPVFDFFATLARRPSCRQDRRRSNHIPTSGRGPSRWPNRAPAWWFARSVARGPLSGPSIPSASPRRILLRVSAPTATRFYKRFKATAEHIPSAARRRRRRRSFPSAGQGTGGRADRRD